MSTPHDPISTPLATEPTQQQQRSAALSPSSSGDTIPQEAVDLPNGPAAAAILSAGIGCLTLGLFAFAGDASPAIGRLFIFHQPTGPLSGVTSSAIVIWLVVWYASSRRWRSKAVAMGRVNLVAFLSLAFGILLTFPPFMDFLQGK
jgi:hypothetical protein